MTNLEFPGGPAFGGEGHPGYGKYPHHEDTAEDREHHDIRKIFPAFDAHVIQHIKEAEKNTVCRGPEKKITIDKPGEEKIVEHDHMYKHNHDGEEEFHEREKVIAPAVSVKHDGGEDDAFPDIAPGPAGEHFQYFAQSLRDFGKGGSGALIKSPVPGFEDVIGQAPVLAIGTLPG